MQEQSARTCIVDNHPGLLFWSIKVVITNRLSVVGRRKTGYASCMSSQTVTIEITPQTAAMLRAKAEAQGVSVDELLCLIFEAPNGKQENIDSLLDWEYLAECAADADPSITLIEVREALSKIPVSMTKDFYEERDER